MDSKGLTTCWLFGFAYGLVYAALALAVVDMLSSDDKPTGHKVVHALMFLVGGACLITAVVRRRRESRAKS